MSKVSASKQSSLSTLTLAALGVVYGDIGTSPLYAFKEALSPAHGVGLSEPNVLAVLSLMFWALMLVVSLKYVSVVLNFDNHGEGGILALLARATRLSRNRPRLAWCVSIMGIAGASLFYGDAVITPAISVTSAVEGTSVVAKGLEAWVVPVTLVILAGLFYLQSRGTASIGRLFGPVMVVWFGTLAVLGVRSILETPVVLAALDPRHALSFAASSPAIAFVVLGAVFLAITGAEALYADMGHFGARPVRLAWFGLVLPALVINYFGQGALVLRDPQAIENPFYLLAPQPLLVPLVLLATAATIIASQATISGAFSITRQATRLGYLPKLPTRHTSETERGQIYIPQVNWALLGMVVVLVLAFRNSSAMASAYGIAVSGTMLLTTVLVGVVAVLSSRSPRPFFLALLGVIGLTELLFFASNAAKFVDGGWFPVACGLVIFVALTTWKRAETVLAAHERARRVPVDAFMALCTPEIPRVAGTAVYLSPDADSVPTVLLHNLKHNKVLHERMVLLTLVDADTPRVDPEDRTEVRILDRGAVYQVLLRYGFMEEPDVPEGLRLLSRHGLQIDPGETTFFLGKTTLARAKKAGLFTWRRELFRWMQRNSPATAEYFKLTPERVIELGTRVAI